ncbi:NCAN [Branchiostoma lanceolatum]|uniref:NCAN protein n=1 Tax=Branchiostoma lanceolatum TaxID=7740 RepID=A0A8K0A6J5_BRALA|nr:NCAN [Branchiostoma lanceolatum]
MVINTRPFLILNPNHVAFVYLKGQLDEDKEQTIEYYEVAVGTDRRFPRTRNNVHPYVNVGLNRTYTFKNLQLIPRSATYYTTVRAHSVLTSVAEVTSNGLQVGYGGQVFSVGHVDVNRTDELHLSWAGFTDPESGIDHYEVAVFSGAACSADSDERFQETDFVPVLFNITDYTVTDISLEFGIPYFVRLRAFNKAGLSIMTESPPILLDLEDPVGGTVKDGRDFSSDVTHQSSITTMEGAYSTRADLQGGGSYTFDMIAASGDIKAVTSVVFWDGPAGVVGDLDAPVEQWAQQEGATEPPDCTCCFGNNTGIVAGGVEGHYAVLWCRFMNDTAAPQQEMIRLDFNPTDGWHSYELKVTTGRTFAVGEDWGLELIIDGRSLVIMNGIPVFSEQAQLTLVVWNRGDFVPAVQDVFSSPEGSASFRDLRFPPSADNLCRFGDPFRPGDNGVSVFYAGVGTKKLMDDVAPFQEVTRPCVPCAEPCDKFACDPDCSSLVTSVFHVRIDNLTLSPNVSFKQLDGVNFTDVAAVYYITVKAVSGSGRATLACSSGVYVDVTSPDIQSIDHVDMSWDDDEIVEYQGSNSTIATRFSAFDRESQIAEYFWAIGTAPWGTDIQPFKSNGLRDMAVNSDLEGVLHHGITYYVTLVAVNGAGLESSVTSSGVKVLLGYPDVTHMNTAVLFGEDLSDDVYPDDVVELSDLTHAGISWERPEEEQAITSIFFSVSSSEDGVDDIFPETRIGFNDSGNIVIADGKVETGGKVVNITDMQQQSASVERALGSSRFVMEPGRTLYPKLLACNGAHRCTAVDVKKLTFILEVVLNKSDSTTVSIATPGGLRMGTTLVSGFLEGYDVSTEYTSDASADFQSFITDPRYTKDITDRWLTNRVSYWLDVNFFVTTLGNVEVPGPINITVPINTTQIEPGLEQRLLYWNLARNRNAKWSKSNGELFVSSAEQAGVMCLNYPASRQGEWQDAQRTCSRGGKAEKPLEWTKHFASFQVCKTNAYSTKRDSGRVRLLRTEDEAEEFFKGSTHFSLAVVNRNVFNSPPVITSDTHIELREDEERAILIEYFDSDNDRLSFSITVPPRFGSARLHDEEEFPIILYKPCLDCYGTDTVNISAVEILPDNMNPHSINIELVVEVEPRNDDPVLFVIVNDSPVPMVPALTVELTVEVNRLSNAGYTDLQIIVAAYDVDNADEINLAIKAQSNYTLLISDGIHQVSFDNNHSCRGQNNWFSAVDVYVKNGTLGPLQLDPCGPEVPHPLQDMGWVFTRLTYRPAINFTGRDIIKVIARDDHGGVSQVMTLDLYVLENLCQHGGVCVGDVTDPNCSSTQRGQGFNGYWCDCTGTSGWSGRLCELDFDDCSSIPCPTNYTCIDKLNGYICDCGDPSWPCGPGLEPWEVGVITGGALAAGLLILLSFFLWKKWQKASPNPSKTGSTFLRSTKVTPTTMSLPSLSSKVSSKPGDGPAGVDNDACPPEASNPNSDVSPGTDALSSSGRPDYAAFLNVPRAWESRDDAERQAAALLNWEWNPKHSVESLDRPTGRLARPATELKELRGAAGRKAFP